jgi:hypothetical protein
MRLRFLVVLVALMTCASANCYAATTSLPPNGSIDVLGDLSQFPVDLADTPAFKALETRVETRTPLPATLSLFAGGLGALGLFGWRRKCREILQNVFTFLEKQWPCIIVALGVVTTIVWIALLTSYPLRLIVSVF